ncbi:MAG: hypothetical protein EAZ42_06670 [Verrucomicrobia bacterium]|nr:MAG: hypothetical protein EAZ42_06670 [Verrucomicrobiota bacterium]
MKILNFLKCFSALILLCMAAHGNDLEAVDGANVRVLHQKDGSKSIFTRSPDNLVLTKKTYTPAGNLSMRTIYKMDRSGNPISCNIFDGQDQRLFKVSYGYHKTTGQLLKERMYDARVRRTDPNTGEEMPIQVLVYLYDAEGNRSAPIVYNLLPGRTFEETFGVKSSSLESNPFQDSPSP